MSLKKQKGQFYTTNYSYILQGLKIPDNVQTIIEPFCGSGELLNFIKKDIILELYDIDPKHPNTIKQDTLLNPPNYNNKFVLTNPPYLAKNKSNDKKYFDEFDDLYKVFINQLINSNPIGGILIIPLNFWCLIRKSDILLRKRFLEKFSIIRMNLFEEKVFEDTSYTTCSFLFENKNQSQKIPIFIYPHDKQIVVSLKESNNYTIGGKMYNLPQDKNIKIERLTKLNQKSRNITNIKVICIDNNSRDKIRCEYDIEKYIDDTENLSARTFATLVISPMLSIEKQKELVIKFNEFLNKKREKYNSLFLTNYRESKDIARKRISFSLVYEIINYLITKYFGN